MRSDVKHKAPCGHESRYQCRKGACPSRHQGCTYTLKTLKKPKDKNKVHPVAESLCEIFVEALMAKLPNTAWCIDLARTALAAELIAEAKGLKTDLFVMTAIRDKIEKDKGVKIY